MQLRVKMVLLWIVGVIEEESNEESVAVPAALKPVRLHVDICELLHVTVAGLPLSTREGLAVKLSMEPANTQMEPARTWPSAAQSHPGA